MVRSRHSAPAAAEADREERVQQAQHAAARGLHDAGADLHHARPGGGGGGQKNGSGQAPPYVTGGAWPRLGWPSGGSRYGSVSTAFSRKDATAPFGSSGAFWLVLHWPFFGPDVYLGPYPAK